MQIEYREANCADASGIYNVETQCFSSPWSLDSIIDDLCDNALARYVVAVEGERIVGFCGLHEILDEGHITNAAVLPSFRRRGVGKKLIEALFSFTENTIDRYTLEVRAGNRAAISLYKRLGFKTLGVRKAYYADNGEDAHIMWRSQASK